MEREEYTHDSMNANLVHLIQLPAYIHQTTKWKSREKHAETHEAEKENQGCPTKF